MKKKVSAVLAMVLACSSLPISIQANARNLYFPWYEPFHNQLGILVELKILLIN
ncbi:MAG: hypothetical protein HDT22_04855 [Ruminococcus sp.]|nr:hypothetical protein [Ruminococcus sp.]